MKQAWSDLKSFVTVAMVILLFTIVIANLLGAVLSETILVLVTNLMTAVFTYYFSKTKKVTVSAVLTLRHKACSGQYVLFPRKTGLW